MKMFLKSQLVVAFWLAYPAVLWHSDAMTPAALAALPHSKFWFTIAFMSAITVGYAFMMPHKKIIQKCAILNSGTQ